MPRFWPYPKKFLSQLLGYYENSLVALYSNSLFYYQAIRLRAY